MVQGLEAASYRLDRSLAVRLILNATRRGNKDLGGIRIESKKFFLDSGKLRDEGVADVVLVEESDELGLRECLDDATDLVDVLQGTLRLEDRSRRGRLLRGLGSGVDEVD